MTESIEDIIRRQEEERLELETNPNYSEEARPHYEHLLKKKHNIEIQIGGMLPTGIDMQRMLESTDDDVEVGQPDPRGGYAYGEIIPLTINNKEVQAIFMGVKNGEALLSTPVVMENGEIYLREDGSVLRIVSTMPAEDLYEEPEGAAPPEPASIQETGDTEVLPDPKQVDPPSVILEVSAELSQSEIVDRVRGYFDVIAHASEDFQRAEYELIGDKKEFNGLRKGLGNLEVRKARLSTTAESPQKEKALQALNRDIADVERRKARAEEVFSGARDALKESMRETIAHLDLLPLALTEAIRNAEGNAADYDAIFRDYNISPTVASMVARALNKNKKTAEAQATESVEDSSSSAGAVGMGPLPQNLSGVYEMRDGHVFNMGTDVQVDRPEFPPEGTSAPTQTALGANISHPAPLLMRAESGVITYDQSLEQNSEQELLDKILKAGQPKSVEYPPISVEQNPALTGIYDTENLPDISKDTPEEVKIESPAPSQEKRSFTTLSWDELKELYYGTDVELTRLANKEWERRAFEIARERGVVGALENTLLTIEEIKEGIIPEGWVPPPEKWLREFQEIPAVAIYLEAHPLPSPVVAPSRATPRERAQREKSRKQGDKMQAELGGMAARAGVERFSNRQLEEMHLDDGAFDSVGEDTTAEEEFEMVGEAYRGRLRNAMGAFLDVPTMTFEQFKNAMGTGKKTTERLLEDLLNREVITLTAPATYTWKEELPNDENSVEEKQESKESVVNLSEVLLGIEQHIAGQPESVKKVLHEAKENFVVAKVIDGKTFLFTGLTKESDSILALVSDEQNPEIFHTRAFRFSGSDHQWKALPGMRAGGGSFMKGEESNPMHHYVQSAKLDKRIYAVLNDLPLATKSLATEDFIPEESQKDGTGGQFVEELTFKEEYTALKDETWAKKQEALQYMNRMYDYLVCDVDERGKFSRNDDFHEWLKRAAATEPMFAELATQLEAVFASHGDSMMGGLAAMKFGDNPQLKSYAESHRKIVGEYFEKRFSEIQLNEMAPDFSALPIDAYEKNDIDGSGKIMIEEFERTSEKGDRLVWAMAHDEQGRVFVDNIYDPSVGMSDYGTPKKITQMGILVYKPEDYFHQTRAIPEQYRTSVGGYEDISKFWALMGPIKRYKAALDARGNSEAEAIIEEQKAPQPLVVVNETASIGAENSIESLIGRELSEIEDAVMKRIVSLETGATDAPTLEKIVGIKRDLLDMMKKSRVPLLPAQITWTTRKL